MNHTAVPLAVSALLLLTGCGEADTLAPSLDCTHIQNEYSLCRVPLPDGRTIDCLIGFRGAMSCDWSPK